jgi:hypothetical protein
MLFPAYAGKEKKYTAVIFLFALGVERKLFLTNLEDQKIVRSVA